jgi:phosphoribosylaminoimidazole-succinocarboxamide synthase
MAYSKIKLAYSGKSKSLYETEDSDKWIAEFRDDLTAFNGVKHEQMARKGALNSLINAHLMGLLAKQGIATHFVQQLSANDSLVRRLRMVPLESVVRNAAAGGICKRLGLSLGMELKPTVYELFYKNDALGDPMVNESHAITFAWATLAELQKMHSTSLEINRILTQTFADIGLQLVDAKFEFGFIGDELYLGDEITPDSCRLWDKETQKILDKDRFRQDLGDVVEAYQEIANRLGVDFSSL